MSVYTAGQSVTLSWQVEDEDGVAVTPDTAVLTITLPDGSTATPTISEDADNTGLYELDYYSAVEGAYSATFVTTSPYGASSATWIIEPGDRQPVALADVKAYLGATSYSDDEIAGALLAETIAQARACRTDDFTYDLQEALCRRVARNLAARSVPVTSFSSFGDGGGTVTRVPHRDPEVVRLEKPYRRLTVG